MAWAFSSSPQENDVANGCSRLQKKTRGPFDLLILLWCLLKDDTRITCGRITKSSFRTVPPNIGPPLF